MDSRTTVLYVDDNPKSSRLLTSVLEECNFRVISKYDPAEALALCRRMSFDLALLDYEMPLMSGAQLAREIKYLMPDVPVVLISGRTSIPQTELEFVDAHFGFGTSLDDLLWTMRILGPPQVVVSPHEHSVFHLPIPHQSRSRQNQEDVSVTAMRWADST
jgi:CheY-like chemotaxis protein